jgi:ABC-type polysaccharide/polyol phosphate export permease
MLAPALRSEVSPRSVHLWGFAWTLIRTDFKARYHGTIGGFAWALMKPLMMFLVLFAVFSFIFGSDPSYRAQLILGVFLYEFFSESTKAGFVSLASKGFLLTKATFPSWIVVAASTINALITLGLFSGVMLVSLYAMGRTPGPLAVALFLSYLLCFFFTVLGICLGASVLFLRYRDLNQVWDITTHAGFFIAPIIYPMSLLPERVHFYLYLWPPTPVIQFARAVLLDGAPPTLRAHAFLFLQAAIIFLVGLTIFRRHVPRAVEYL